MSLKAFDIVELTINPGFSTFSRVGEQALVIQLWDNTPYLAVMDKRGVTWPLDESQVKKIGNLWELMDTL